MYEETGHSASYYVTRLQSLREVEKRLLSGGGVSNAFNIDIVVLHNGKIMKYRVLSNGEYISWSDVDFTENSREATSIEWEETK